METFLRPGCAPDQQGAPKVAVVVPGAGYKVESPLLDWPAELLKDRGWHVRAIRWTDAAIRTTLSRTTKADLLIGGLRDKFWDTAGLSGTAGTFVEIDDADHSLQVPNDWRASQAAQAQAFTAAERFVVDIGIDHPRFFLNSAAFEPDAAGKPQ
ncbi:hypothetical protein E7Y32_07500 [Arthrobacter sp. UKPF54-2]|uniref:hypothetical protein n=1 Tax=Arthrobacter sp. UKPF54-2 TaxID=2600159 RepID=UPI0011B14FF8|nr:hypothetical protein [Arthrobacter sp. UKPF54-2]QDY90071.1 hypothetical protein E7Y32_07500 [Arthrobacter sp. UKPF54-2]